MSIIPKRKLSKNTILKWLMEIDGLPETLFKSCTECPKLKFKLNRIEAENIIILILILLVLGKL